jgi:hypothetical protein
MSLEEARNLFEILDDNFTSKKEKSRLRNRMAGSFVSDPLSLEEKRERVSELNAIIADCRSKRRQLQEDLLEIAKKDNTQVQSEYERKFEELFQEVDEVKQWHAQEKAILEAEDGQLSNAVATTVQPQVEAFTGEKERLLEDYGKRLRQKQQQQKQQQQQQQGRNVEDDLLLETETNNAITREGFLESYKSAHS